MPRIMLHQIVEKLHRFMILLLSTPQMNIDPLAGSQCTQIKLKIHTIDIGDFKM